MVKDIYNDTEINIITSIDCGNSPKKELLRDFNIALAKKDLDFLLDNIADNISWNIIGEEIFKGKENFMVIIDRFIHSRVKEIELKNIITHGNTAAANGVLSFQDESIIDFCHVYSFNSFKNGKIKEITSYIINNP